MAALSSGFIESFSSAFTTLVDRSLLLVLPRVGTSLNGPAFIFSRSASISSLMGEAVSAFFQSQVTYLSLY